MVLRFEVTASSAARRGARFAWLGRLTLTLWRGRPGRLALAGAEAGRVVNGGAIAARRPSHLESCGPHRVAVEVTRPSCVLRAGAEESSRDAEAVGCLPSSSSAESHRKPSIHWRPRQSRAPSQPAGTKQAFSFGSHAAVDVPLFYCPTDAPARVFEKGAPLFEVCCEALSHARSGRAARERPASSQLGAGGGCARGPPHRPRPPPPLRTHKNGNLQKWKKKKKKPSERPALPSFPPSSLLANAEVPQPASPGCGQLGVFSPSTTPRICIGIQLPTRHHRLGISYLAARLAVPRVALPRIRPDVSVRLICPWQRARFSSTLLYRYIRSRSERRLSRASLGLSTKSHTPDPAAVAALDGRPSPSARLEAAHVGNAGKPKPRGAHSRGGKPHHPFAPQGALR